MELGNTKVAEVAEVAEAHCSVDLEEQYQIAGDRHSMLS